MKQGTLKTLGVIALGAVAVITGGSAASAAPSAPVPGGSAGRVAAPGQPAAQPAAPQAKPGQGVLGQLPLQGLPTGSLFKLG
ncbi:ATP-binding protein [Streptomyces sp. NPDC020125]|uniref:ATP-binding protein n=1 Tax=Streptomyces sp. NPDC020125 TaxID=3154593 RepID=UPI0033C8F2FB